MCFSVYVNKLPELLTVIRDYDALARAIHLPLVSQSRLLPHLDY